jgi:hypothetical protein
MISLERSGIFRTYSSIFILSPDLKVYVNLNSQSSDICTISYLPEQTSGGWTSMKRLGKVSVQLLPVLHVGRAGISVFPKEHQNLRFLFTVNKAVRTYFNTKLHHNHNAEPHSF